MIYSLIMSELFPACSSCSNYINLSQSSVGFFGKNIVYIPEARIAGDLTNLISDLCLVFFLSKVLTL